jgi:hypothetical protein
MIWSSRLARSSSAFCSTKEAAIVAVITPNMAMPAIISTTATARPADDSGKRSP